MIHPFSEDTADLSVNELHDKVAELSKKYFQTQILSFFQKSFQCKKYVYRP